MNTKYLIATLIIALSMVIFPFVIYPGDRIMVVQSDSMLPTLKPYDMIVVKPTSIEQIQVGDIITFNVHLEDIDIVAHRVVGIVDDHGDIGLETKGDNVDDIDEWIIVQGDLIGRVVSHIPNIGILLIDPVRYPIIAFIMILSFGISWQLSHGRKMHEKNTG